MGFPAQNILALAADEFVSYTAYTQLAKDFAARHHVPIVPANSSSTISGTGVFTGQNLREQLSFTPYIFNACSAKCLFCSERLTRKQAMPKHLHTSETYEAKLNQILEGLRGHRLFLSLSGMEPLESLPLLEQILRVFTDFILAGGNISERVIYSNLSMLGKNPDAVLRILHHYNISRVESSRHHYNQKVNQDIMGFRPGEPISSNSVYEKAIYKIQGIVPVRLACVLQKKGINNVQEVEHYIGWAASLGVQAVTFRELALLGNAVHGGSSYRYVLENRQSIHPLIANLPDTFQLESITQGYYYVSFRYRYKNMVNVTFGVSDYAEMVKHHEGNVVNKLVYYPDGSLCRDWNMQGRIC